MRWHHQLNGHGFEPTPGVGDGQGGLACCSPWGRKEPDTTERLNSSKVWQAFTNMDCHGEKAPTFSNLFPTFCGEESSVQGEDTWPPLSTFCPEDSEPPSGLWSSQRTARMCSHNLRCAYLHGYFLFLIRDPCPLPVMT